MKSIAPSPDNVRQESLPIAVKKSPQNVYQSLWLCIYFPKLAAHALEMSEEQPTPFVVFEENTQKRNIYYASSAAQRIGIEKGMDLSKAVILCEHIRAYPRDSEKEKSLIKILAEWAIKFSPHVSIKYESSILIEIRGSLKLFNGIHQLQKKIAHQLQKKNYICSIATSPTPLASFLFSRASRNIIIEDKNTLRTELGKLHLHDFLIDPKSLNKLQSIGIQQGYELFRLPPASMARRFGQSFCCYLNELLGITHENIAPLQTRRSFHESYEFQKDQENLEIILIHANILLKSVLRFLIQNDLSTRKLTFTVYSSRQKQTVITILSNIQCRNEKTWKNLIRERFYSIPLNNSIYKINLTADTFDPYIPENENILRNNIQRGHADWETTLDQLAARLGSNHIYSLDTVEDYRPEHSQIKKTYTSHQSVKKKFLLHSYRPTWLLAKPICINNTINSLQKSHNIERIEDGWWDKNPVRRDYFIAKNKNNELLWIFTDLSNCGQHFIHGYFA